MGDQHKNGVKTLGRALDVLEEVGSIPEGLTLTEVCERVRLHKSTVLRLLSTLTERGYVRKDPQSQRYNLGLKILNLTSEFLSSIQFRDVAQPHMRRLQQLSEETVNLAILDGSEVVYVDRKESPKVTRPPFKVGKRAPAHCTALGKAILAFTDPDVTLRILTSTVLQKSTEHTVVDPESLMAQFQHICQSGVAIDDQEHQLNVRCVASPIFDITGRVIASISVTGPVSRMNDERLPELCSMVKAAAASISRELGWQPGHSSFPAET